MKEHIKNTPSSLGGLFLSLVVACISMITALGWVELTSEQVTAILAFTSLLIAFVTTVLDITFDKYKQVLLLRKQDS